MENKEQTVENQKVEGTGAVAQTEEKKENTAEVEMISKEEAQKMVDKALAKRLPPKEEMDAFKQWKDSQKTEADKQAEKDKQLTIKEQETNSLKQKLAVADKDVLKEFRGYVQFEVSQMEGDFEDNLDKFLKDNPKYLSKETASVTTGVQTKTVTKTEDGVTAILKQKHPELFK